jgi:hypothetical protein
MPQLLLRDIYQYYFIILCEYKAFPTYNRVASMILPSMSKEPLIVGSMFSKNMVEMYKLDTDWYTEGTKEYAKTNIIPGIISFSTSYELPFVSYIHDFPLSASYASRLFEDPANRWNNDWSKPTLQETRDYAQEFLTWLIGQLEALNVFWMARSDYSRRYGAGGKFKRNITGYVAL